MTVTIREFIPANAPGINALALAAFEQYQNDFSDWPAFRERLALTATLAERGEFIVAESDGTIVGGVAYIAPFKPKNRFFEPEWAIMRMLMVSPKARGEGLGRRLAEECLQRARRDNTSVFALHTTPIMKVAVPMYERMGFKYLRDAPPLLGVPYAVYTMRL